MILGILILIIIDIIYETIEIFISIDYLKEELSIKSF
tara:strand:- start:707 stop:817 length:111 start_codon:yes stop_codon:yes gene_type:complete